MLDTFYHAVAITPAGDFQESCADLCSGSTSQAGPVARESGRS